MFQSVAPSPRELPIPVEPFPELEWEGGKNFPAQKKPVFDTPIPTPRQIVARELSKMSAFPEDNE
jgi:hypothetical protein